MFRNYFKIAVRNLRKNKGYTVINLLGLTIGIVCCILIMLYIYDELSFDRFHTHSERIYRIVDSETSPDQVERHYGITAAPVGPTMEEEFPDVINSARLITFGRHTVQNGDIKFYEEYLVGEPSLFEIFDLEFVAGDPHTALQAPETAVLSEEMARKYFGDADPIGKTLSSDRNHELQITGVVALPHNSHLQFDMLISFATFANIEQFREYLERWDVQAFTTYVLLNEHNNMPATQEKLPDMLATHSAASAEVDRRLALQPLADIHFGSAHIEYDRNAGKGEMAYIYIFGAIAMFIVLIACINYMNLATARSFNRATEVGLRKVVGAQRSQIIGQFLSESILFSLLALILAFVIVQNILPLFNSFTGKEMQLDIGQNSVLLISLVCLTLFVGMAAGSYPAFYLSNLAVVRVLKGKLRAGSGQALLRRGLVVVQFALSIIMIVSTLVVFNQMNYVRNKRLGFNQEHLVVVDINSGAARSNFQTIKTEFARHNDVRSVSVSSRVPGEWKSLQEIEALPAGASEAEARTMIFLGVDSDFLRTFEIELLTGRNFLPDRSTDTTAVLLNETAAGMLGGESVLNKTIVLQQSDSRLPVRVIGIVKDFHVRSLHEKIGPVVLGHSHAPLDNIDYFTARISGNDIPKTLEHLRHVHEKFDQVTPFEYHFLDQQIARFYAEDRRVGTLFGIAAGLAIFVACLGLFGLAAFTAEQRTKEIGVRKVLGATVPQIVFLLSKEFSKLVLIALIVAAPLAFIFARNWLEEFAYQTEIGPTIFVAAGLLALMVAWVTVSFQAVKAALANPVDSLRYE